MYKVLVACLLMIGSFASAQSVRYEAQLAHFQVEIGQELIFAFMPELGSQKAKEIQKKYERPEGLTAFANYNEFEAYLQGMLYEKTKAALRERFGITITGMVEKTKANDSTVYGYPLVSKSGFKENSAFYFVKLQYRITTLENTNMVDGQPADQSTVTPVIQVNLILFDKKGKKVKKASGKFQSGHFVEGQVKDFTLWDEKTRLRGFRASPLVRDTYVQELLMKGLGKLQENFYK